MGQPDMASFSEYNQRFNGSHFNQRGYRQGLQCALRLHFIWRFTELVIILCKWDHFFFTYSHPYSDAYSHSDAYSNPDHRKRAQRFRGRRRRAENMLLEWTRRKVMQDAITHARRCWTWERECNARSCADIWIRPRWPSASPVRSL